MIRFPPSNLRRQFYKIEKQSRSPVEIGIGRSIVLLQNTSGIVERYGECYRAGAFERENGYSPAEKQAVRTLLRSYVPEVVEAFCAPLEHFVDDPDIPLLPSQGDPVLCEERDRMLIAGLSWKEVHRVFRGRGVRI